jgi:hypothetical protein
MYSAMTDVVRFMEAPGYENALDYLWNDVGGVSVVEGEALADGKNPTKMTAIPYYAWQNRTKGAMTVWIQEAAKP